MGKGWVFGSVAQWSVQAAHNRKDASSIPAGSTIINEKAVAHGGKERKVPKGNVLFHVLAH